MKRYEMESYYEAHCMQDQVKSIEDDLGRWVKFKEIEPPIDLLKEITEWATNSLPESHLKDFDKKFIGRISELL